MTPPEGTRAWRKSHRRKWRPTSTYRSLTLLQREVLRYVEDNADDDGRVVVTTGQLAEFVSSPRERIPRSSVYKAVLALVHRTLVFIDRDGVQQSGQQGGQPPLVLVRVNWTDFQRAPALGVQQGVQQSGPCSRGRQKDGEEASPPASPSAAVAAPLPGSALTPSKPAPRTPKRTPPNPRHAPLVARLVATFAAVRGLDYGFTPRDAKAVSALLALADDDEIDRRWTAALRIPGFYRCDALHELAGKWNAFGPGGNASTQVVGAPTRARPRLEGWEASPRSEVWRDSKGRTLDELRAVYPNGVPEEELQ